MYHYTNHALTFLFLSIPSTTPYSYTSPRFHPLAAYFFGDPFEADPYASYTIDSKTPPQFHQSQSDASPLHRLKHHFVRRHFHTNGRTPGFRPKFPVPTRTEVGGPKMYRCPCGRNYSLLRNFNYHSRWECGRVYDCTKCGKQYKDVSSYRKHTQMCDAPTTPVIPE